MRSILAGKFDRGVRRAAAVVLVLMVVALLAAQKITTSAFAGLEAQQIGQDAQRVRIGLDGWVDVLRNYGATNSIWDGSYEDLRTGNKESFASDFPPADLTGLYGLSGILAVGRDGLLRAGGIAQGEVYAAPAPGMSTPAELKALFDPSAAAGESRCGTVETTSGPYVYCGFASHRTDGGDDVAGGLIYLRALTAKAMQNLGEQLDMPMTLAQAPPAGTTRQAGLASKLGPLAVATAPVTGDRMSLTVAIGTSDGEPVYLQALRKRHISGVAVAVARWLMALMCVLGAAFLITVIVVMRAEVKHQIGPLRRTAEKVITSGDRTLRIASTAPGEVGKLSATIDQMLGVLDQHDTDLRYAQEMRDVQQRQSAIHERLNRQYLSRRAEKAIDATARTVVEELRAVAEQVEEVRVSTGSIDEQAHATETTTSEVRGRAQDGTRTAEAVGESLHKVSGIAKLIAGVADQTNMLALNATIEAARAGEAGRGFAVVAGEVKSLAATTSTSTTEIASTLSALQRDVSAMSEVMTAMMEGVAGIGRQAVGLAEVSDQQRAAMSSLDASVQAAMERVRTMTVTKEGAAGDADGWPDGTMTLMVGAEQSLADILEIGDGAMRCHLSQSGEAWTDGMTAQARLPKCGGEVVLEVLVDRAFPDDDGVELWLGLVDPDRDAAELEAYVDLLLEFDV